MRMDKPAVELLELWFEELQTFKALEAEEEKRFRVLLEKAFHRCNHGDESACLFWDISTQELQRRFEDEVSAELEWLITGTIERYILDCYVVCNLKGDCACADYILTVFTELSPKLRKWCLQHMYKEYLDALAKLLGSEVVDILSKTRIEVKLVLEVGDVLPLIRRFGKEWREKVKETFREALKMVVSK